MTIICVCGLSGSGKTALAKILHECFGYIHVHIKTARLQSSSLVSEEEESVDASLVFENCEDALDELTSRWKENFVVSELLSNEDYETLLKRPFTYFVEVVSPVSIRFARLSAIKPAMSVLDLVTLDDEILYSGLALFPTFKRAKVSIINDESLDTLQQKAIANGLNEDKWVRPSWDTYFVEMAELASLRSNCMKRSVGAVLVKDKRVVATGYNGTATGLVNCRSGGCVRCNSNARCGVGLDHCYCLHAEENALLEAGRVRSEGSTLYCTTAPCLGCSQKIIQCGVIRVVYAKEYSIEHNAQALMKSVGVELVKFINPTPHTVK
jgi:dCMP deaminase